VGKNLIYQYAFCSSGVTWRHSQARRAASAIGIDQCSSGRCYTGIQNQTIGVVVTRHTVRIKDIWLDIGGKRFACAGYA
jgi:hypothetical protein